MSDWGIMVSSRSVRGGPYISVVSFGKFVEKLEVLESFFCECDACFIRVVSGVVNEEGVQESESCGAKCRAPFTSALCRHAKYCLRRKDSVVHKWLVFVDRVPRQL